MRWIGLTRMSLPMPLTMPSFASSYRLPRNGLTLVEMLVAMTLTLILMGAVTQVFGMLGQGINGSRTLAALNDRMRSTAFRLRQDLAGITVEPSHTPPVAGSQNVGYLEIIEGPASERWAYINTGNGSRFDKAGAVPGPSSDSDDRLVGDVDDVILFTTRSPGEPFAGRADLRNNGLEGGSVRSPYAEVCWFCLKNDNSENPQTYSLYRRQRLVVAHPGCEPFSNTSAAQPQNSFGGQVNTLPFSDWSTLATLTDISCRIQGNVAVPNALVDLARRENRFMHATGFPSVFPLPMYASANQLNTLTFNGTPQRFGEDIILTNVLAFDVRVWDPDAIVQAVPASIQTGAITGSAALAATPGDPGYGAPGATAGASGAYADLAWGRAGSSPYPSTAFQQLPGNVSKAPASQTLQDANVSWQVAVYDTWTNFYEGNGVDDDGNNLPDDGANGVDDDGVNGVDDAGESETMPPYRVPLNGIQIRIRCYEPSSRQVRQITVQQTF